MPWEQDAKRTIGALLDRACHLNGDSIAIVGTKGETWTYLQLRWEAERVARGLLWLGIEPGDRVGIWMPNSADWIAAYLATCLIGGVLVPVNTALKEEEARYIVDASGCRCLIVDADFRDGILLAGARMILTEEDQRGPHLVVSGGGGADGGVTLERLREQGRSIEQAQLHDRTSRVGPADLALLLYTSGSTGRPKGVMHDQGIVEHLADFAERINLTPADTVVLYLPLFHVFGGLAILSFLYARGRVVLMQQFNAEQSLELIEKWKATVVYGVTATYCDQLDHPKAASYNLNSVRLCLVPASSDLIRRVSQAMGPAMNVYGMTESSSMTSVPNPDDSEELRSETVGYRMPLFEVKVAREDGSLAEIGESGELMVRGRPVMRGYWNDPAATEKVLDRSGWFRTGDAVQQREDGYIRFLGRIDDMLKVGGENVDPVEVENVLMRHPAVSLAAVVGTKDARLGEVPVAYVQLRAGATATTAEIVELAKEHLAFFKVPKQTHIIERIPLTGSGKVQKQLLSQWARDERTDDE